MEAENRTFSKNVTQAMKGIAILLMMFHHLFSHSQAFVNQYAVQFAPFSRDAVNLASEGGAICVSMFVFLTGYGMMLSLRKRNWRERESYAVHRYLKLAVSFLIVFVFSIATSFLRPDHLSMYFQDGKASAVRYILTDALGFAKYAGTPEYNGNWWYISFAVFLIFLMPLITTLVQRYGIAVVVLAGLAKSFGIDPARPLTRFLLALTLGAWLADRRLLDRLEQYLNTFSRRILFLFVSMFLCLSGYAIHLRFDLNPWANAFVILCLVLFLFTLIDLCGVRLHVLEFCGIYSMNIYLVHSLIFRRYFTTLVYAPKHFILIELTLLCLSLAVSIPLSFLQKKVLNKLHL